MDRNRRWFSYWQAKGLPDFVWAEGCALLALTTCCQITGGAFTNVVAAGDVQWSGLFGCGFYSRALSGRYDWRVWGVS